MTLILESFKLTNKTALVTGGTSGIGRAISLGLAEAGADVVAVSRDLSRVKKVALEIRSKGRRTLVKSVDVTQVKEVVDCCTAIERELSPIHILVNCAGTTVKSKAEDLSMEDWERIIHLNLTSVFLTSQIVGRLMIERGEGVILNVASIGSQLAIRGSAAYCASKGGLIQLTRVLACEWAPYGVRVNAIAPAYFKTPMTSGIMSSKGFIEQLKELVPLRRPGRLEELKGIAVFLSSSASSYINGEIIFVDGGWSSLAL